MPVGDLYISPTQLRAIRALPELLALARDLGYERPARPVNPDELGLANIRKAYVSRSHGTMQRGYGVLLGEAEALPRSLRGLAKAVQNNIHDQPLAMVGIGNGRGWERLVILRPRQTGGQLGAVTVARLDVDLRYPTRHDCEVISGLRWRADLDDRRAQEEVASALDIEAVTRRFYLGLRPHFERLEKAVFESAARNPARQVAVDAAGGSRRVTIRILAQLLFCYFLQRKGLLAAQRDFLNRAWSERTGPFYSGFLEPLFYESLSVPSSARKVGGAARDIPFLNGGLFERRYGEVSLDLPDEVFALDEGLLGYLNHWTFTVAEETADEVEVAVDPEMLGRIFESLLPDVEREQKGTYYTPRPVVQFMCREALVARLSSDALPEYLLRTLVSDEAPLGALAERGDARAIRTWMTGLDSELASLTIIDPAVGSGAFLLGMLGEIVRLRGHAHEALHGRPPNDEEVHGWKLHAIERSLFGVDVEPTAVELCRLRLWLSLVVELDASRPVPPLPNLDFRTVCANSLVDFVEGVEIQNTRRGHMASMFDQLEAGEVVRLRAAYFEAATPTEKAALRGMLVEEEDRLLGAWLGDKEREWGRAPAVRRRLEMLHEQLLSPDRIYPVFMPGFSAPDVWAEGGWDVVIMNPPYVGRKEIPQRWPELVPQIERHFGQTRDLMILFAERALELARPGGVIAMIFNDSIFTSTDADEFRRSLFATTTPTVIARTKCFEGQAVNGGVIVTRTSASMDGSIRWVEGYRRPVADFAAASAPLEDIAAGEAAAAGEMEVFVAPREAYLVLPHRPLYRPSRPALTLRDLFPRAVSWDDFARWPTQDNRTGWPLLSQTAGLERYIDQARETGLYERMEPGQWVLLGLVTEGGVGLQTGDDRRYVAAIEGTVAAEEHCRLQERLERVTLGSAFADEYRGLLRTHGDRESALLALWTSHGGKRPNPLPWPRTGTFRIVRPQHVVDRPLSAEERESGIAGPRHWVAFEKGDQSQELEDEEGNVSRIGAAWERENPIVIDWAREAVALLRRRATSKGAQKPYFRNEQLWFTRGITWNRVASYLRARVVPETAIFADMAPLLRALPWIDWLSTEALLSLLNSDTVNFILRTFLASRMHIELGDLRRLIVPVLAVDQKAELERLMRLATKARRDGDRGLAEVERDLNAYVRKMYGIPRTSELWVVR
ncbi:MAG: hypothetical protein KGK34_01060 [Chloroflexota bacterium]|nr:hypothetical protein [Chloroflexota bacterium]